MDKDIAIEKLKHQLKLSNNMLFTLILSNNPVYMALIDADTVSRHIENCRDLFDEISK